MSTTAASADPDSHAMLDRPDVQRVKTVALGILVGAILVTAIVAGLFYAISPEHGVWAAVGVGAMVGFWTAPLFGGVPANGLHEWRLEQAEKAEKAEKAQ